MKIKNFVLTTALVLGIVLGSNAQQWNTTGNVGLATDFIGTTNYTPIIFKMNNTFSGALTIGQLQSSGAVVSSGTSFGYNSLLNNTSNGSSAFGAYALYSNTNTTFNSAFGTGSLMNTTTGSYNTALGVYTMKANVTGNNNIAIGYAALGANPNGAGNIAIGFDSMAGTAGDGNIAIGYRAFWNSTASGNIGLGGSVFANLVTPSTFNVAVGSEAGLYLSTGNYNSFFGRSSGRGSVNSNTGSSNSFFGYDSGINISTGNLNSSFGYASGSTITTGGGNSFFGNQSGAGLTTGNYNVFLGSVQIPNAPATATSPGNDTSRTIILADGGQNTKLYIHSNGFTGIGLGNNVIPRNTLEVKAVGGSPVPSGLRLTGLPNTSGVVANPLGKVLSVDANGDVILVNDQQGTGSGGTTTNTLINNGVNTMTSTVNGIAATAPIVNTVVNIITTGQLTTTVNGVSSTPVDLPTLVEVDGDVTNEIQHLSQTPINSLTGLKISLDLGGGDVWVDGSETKIQAGTNVTVSGNGTIATPYVINSTPTNNPTCNIYTCNGTIDTSADIAQGVRIVTMGENNLFFNNAGTTDPTRGKVYIGNNAVFGTPASLNNYNLYVEKGILTEKVKVALRSSVNWADYVFANDYKLMPLAEVATFINKNKHLPGVSSAENLVKEGLDLGEMQAKQMEKIEELTLYAIEQNKKIEKQEKEIEELKVLVNALVNKK